MLPSNSVFPAVVRVPLSDGQGILGSLPHLCPNAAVPDSYAAPGQGSQHINIPMDFYMQWTCTRKFCLCKHIQCRSRSLLTLQLGYEDDHIGQWVKIPLSLLNYKCYNHCLWVKHAHSVPSLVSYLYTHSIRFRSNSNRKYERTMQ